MDKFVVRKRKITENDGVDDVVRKQLEVDQGSSIDKESSENRNTNIVPSRENIKRWQEKNPWLQLNETNKAICSICAEVCNKKLKVNFDSRATKSKQAWVNDGFSNWKHAAERIKAHLLSSLHIESAEILKNNSSTNIVQKLSSAHQKQMMDNRIALTKIFSTLLVLGQQGLPIRGRDNDERSNFKAILKARSEDVPELKAWFERNGYKFFHHSIQNEILDLMANSVLTPIMDEIRKAEFFSILLDETADVSNTEQVSICLRFVCEDLSTKEYFIGFFSTPDTKSKTLFDLVNEVFSQFKLPLCKLRGQCYDGASNVSGKISGLQKRIREEEPRALFVHCNAHNLNLVVQDSLEKVLIARKFIGTLKDLINFVRDSPKRLAQFKEFQIEKEHQENVLLPSLAAYCPTRWVLRVKSLKTVRDNYGVLIKFFYSRSMDKDIDSAVSAKALGFFEFMSSFECFFMLTMMIEIFNKIEVLNMDLQNSNLCVINSYEKVDAIRAFLETSRESKFHDTWKKSVEKSVELELDEPMLPRQRKLTKRLDQGASEQHLFKTPEQFFRQQFFLVYDQLVESLRNRFQNDSAKFYKVLEQFALGDKSYVHEVVEFYGKDFNKEKLLSDMEMFKEFVKRKKKTVKSLQDIVDFLKANEWCQGLIDEYVRFLRVVLTIPGSSCSNERSFSVLRRLKNYLRSTMLQDRLNNVAILHIYTDEASKIDINNLMNDFISKTSKRSTVFALSK